jgi:hypothetical protein
MSSIWTQKDEKKSLIKNEHSNDNEHSNLSNSSNTTSSSTTTPTNNQQQQQTAIIDSIYSEPTTLKNLNIISSNNLQEHGKINLLIYFLNTLLYKLETGQFIRSDLQSYTDPIVYYGDGLIDPLQQNYPHLQQGK